MLRWWRTARCGQARPGAHGPFRATPTCQGGAGSGRPAPMGRTDGTIMAISFSTVARRSSSAFSRLTAYFWSVAGSRTRKTSANVPAWLSERQPGGPPTGTGEPQRTTASCRFEPVRGRRPPCAVGTTDSVHVSKAFLRPACSSPPVWSVLVHLQLACLLRESSLLPLILRRRLLRHRRPSRCPFFFFFLFFFLFVFLFFTHLSPAALRSRAGARRSAASAARAFAAAARTASTS